MKRFLSGTSYLGCLSIKINENDEILASQFVVLCYERPLVYTSDRLSPEFLAHIYNPRGPARKRTQFSLPIEI